jgi:hypothetical protein
VFGKKEVGMIFGTEINEEIGRWTKLRSEEVRGYILSCTLLQISG